MRTILIVLITFCSGVAFAGDIIRIGEPRKNDPVQRMQPVNLTNSLVQAKVVDTVEEVEKKPKENYRYRRPVHPKKLYKDVLICKGGYCRVIRVKNE